VQTLHIQLAEVKHDCVELIYFFDRRSDYERRVLNLAAIQDLIKQAKQNYYLAQRPNLEEIGKRLFFWLDEHGQWLSRAIQNCLGEGLILAITTGEKLAHLPWEVLHDGTELLIKRINPVVMPVRWIDRPTEVRPLERRPLRVLFMATSPEEVEPELDFEQEEARILEATRDFALDLRVEESGCIAGLGKVWSRYVNTWDVFHLTGHASISTQHPYTPYFIMETETGERYEATVAEIAETLRFRWPQLVFLSGCRTGQAADNGAVPSMAEALIHEGATAVLGWGLSVKDVAATVAAAHLYGKLAAGYRLPEALASTYRQLGKDKVEDWHLLRLYVRGECPGAFVEPLGDQIWLRPELAYEQFLDPATQMVRVATPEEFVGRRRTLQHCLKALRTPSNLEVLLYGMAGVGKSTVAARLLERMTGYDNRIIIHRDLNEAKLLGALSDKCTSEEGHKILNSQLPLMQRLTNFLQQRLNQPEQRFLFVLDDFEANLKLRTDGVQVLQAAPFEVLMALLRAIAQCRLPHRLIITCRYNFHLPAELDYRLHREPLDSLRGADLRKKCDRLPAFNSQSQVEPELQEQAKQAAHGNPRLLEWLNKILLAKQVDQTSIFQQMADKVAKFREEILAEALLNQQPAALRRMLGLAFVFKLPVPRAAITAICSDISNLDQYISRATDLGLLEISHTQAEPHYRVPRILESLLSFPADSDPKILYRTAAKSLFEIWGESALLKTWHGEAGITTEAQLLEIHRLAQRGKAGDIAFWTGQPLAVRWRKQGRFRDTVWLCHSILEIVKDYRIFHILAWTEEKLGDQNCYQHYQKALDLCPLEDEIERANMIHNFAYFHIDQGRIAQALILNQHLRDLAEYSNNLEFKANALHQLADIKDRQRQTEPALKHYKQALKLRRQISDDQGVVETLNNIACIYLKQNQLDVWENFIQENFEFFARSGNFEEETKFLNNIAFGKIKQKRFKEAIGILRQLFERYKHTGDVEFLAKISSNIANAYVEQGQLTEALTHYQEAFQLLGSGNAYLQAEVLCEIGIVYFKQGEFLLALANLKKSLEIGQQFQSYDAEKAKEMIAGVEQMTKG